MLTGDKVEKLISAVGSYPELYDKSNKKYRDVRKKEIIWKQISEELECTVSEVKKKWTYLRDKFQKENVKRNNPSGSGAQDLAAWGYFEHLMFLKDNVKTHKTYGNYQKKIGELLADSLNSNCSSDMGNEQVEISDDDHGNVSVDHANSGSSSSKPTKRKNDVDDEAAELIGIIKKKYISEDDPIDHFCGFLKSYLKKFPPHLQDESIGYITNYILEQNKKNMF